jgi:hypothetical protein
MSYKPIVRVIVVVALAAGLYYLLKRKKTRITVPGQEKAKKAPPIDARNERPSWDDPNAPQPYGLRYGNQIFYFPN